MYNLGFPGGSQCYLFINHMHGTAAALIAAASFHIQTTYQSICRADNPRADNPLLLMFCASLRINRSFAVLKRQSASVPGDQGSRANTPYDQEKAKLHRSSCHSPHLQAACKHFFKVKKDN